MRIRAKPFDGARRLIDVVLPLEALLFQEGGGVFTSHGQQLLLGPPLGHGDADLPALLFAQAAFTAFPVFNGRDDTSVGTKVPSL